MITIGKQNQLIVDAEFPFGYQLAAPNDPRDVILPSVQVKQKLKPGESVSVFVYPDENGNLSATTKPPKVTAGSIALLKAVGVTEFGAFFEWGMERDLLVPSEYQEMPIIQGMVYPVHCFYDEKSSRLLGATRLHYFYRDMPDDLQEQQEVELLVYSKSDLGFKVVINESCLGLIFHSDAFMPLKVGQQTTGYIKTIRDDGKVDVSLQKINAEARSTLQEAILEDLQAHGGISTLTDKSPPEEIYTHFKVSKGAYKKALGALYKQQKIILEKNVIKLR